MFECRMNDTGKAEIISPYSIPGILQTTNKIILKEILNHFKIQHYELISNDRERNYCDARKITAGLLFYHSKTNAQAKRLTFEDLGEMLGKRDHSTINHYLKEMVKLSGDKLFNKHVSEICKKANLNHESVLMYLSEYVRVRKRKVNPKKIK